MKKTLVVGASPNPSRYSHMASHELAKRGKEFILLGIRRGVVAGQEIHDLRSKPGISNVDTITLYIGPRNQPEWYNYLLDLDPRRIIFNPGTENEEFARFAREKGIEVQYGCTLVMLSLNTY